MEELLDLVDTEEAKIGSGADWDEEAIETAYESLRDEAYEMLALIAHLVKAPGFSGENEVRVVATLLFEESHIRYRPSANGVVGYVDLTNEPADHGFDRVLQPKFDGDTPQTGLSIKSVRLGPLLQDEHPSTIRGMLRKFKLNDVSVLTSNVELR